MDCNQANQLFASHDLRCTKQRHAIYAALTASRCHPTADELYRKVQHQLPGLSLATVYNTLECFTEKGLIQKLPDAGHNGSARYDAHTDHHTHLRDACTGEIQDAPDDLSHELLAQIKQEVLAKVQERTGFRVDHVEIELVGQFESDRA
ncbi:MAG: Fur family transcriptional regulator [Phycisphaerales bacterium JB063]